MLLSRKKFEEENQMALWQIIVGLIIFFAAPVLGLCLWVKFFNNSDGERYAKMRFQGPFAPVHDHEENDSSSSNTKNGSPTK
jgi:hypothetical protein